MIRKSGLSEVEDALLREIHHRVRNNMQIISSLLSLQSRITSHPETVEVLADVQNRIWAMALLHETLYETGDVSAVEFGRYIRQMVEDLFRRSEVSTHRVRFRVDLPETYLKIDTALPCALIVNELVSNSLKHAFPGGRSGEVHIAMEKGRAGTASLIVKDNGVGLDAATNVLPRRTLGHRLIRMLALQLDAKLEIVTSGGTEVRLTFAIDPAG